MCLCQHSDVYSSSVLRPDSSPSRATDNACHSHSQSSPPTPSTSSSPKTLLVPPSIPEHHELSSVSHQHTQPTCSSSSSRRTSVAATENSESLEAVTDEMCRTRCRRRSVPVIITSDTQADINVFSARRHSQQRITQMLSNFPKVNALMIYVVLYIQ